MTNATMIRSWVAAAVLSACACTIVNPEGPGDAGGQPTPVPRPNPPPPPPPLHAHVLFVANLHRSSANLADHYVTLIRAIPAGLDELGLKVDRWAVAPTYAGPDGPRLLMGGKAAPALGVGGDGHGDSGGDDLGPRLRDLAVSGRYDDVGEVAEARNVIRIGQGLGTGALPPQEGGIERDAFFDQPRSLFMVVYLQPLRRRCALADQACRVDGQSPAQVFTARNTDGTLSWLRFAGGAIRPEQVVHIAIGTSEDESPEAFRERCRKVPGFPQNLFDVIEPSPASYFGPLMSAVNGAARGTGQQADFCELIGSDPKKALDRLSTQIAALAR